MKFQAIDSDEKPVYFGRDLKAMSFAVNYHNWIINEFSPYFGANVAEVGAGTGNFTELLIAANANIKRLVAFEPSTNMYPVIEERFAGVKYVETVNCYFGSKYNNPNNDFDSVVYINVLEHIKDDEKELSHVYRSLKSGGHALIFVPALSWLYSDLDKELGHYRRYNKQRLIRLVQSMGFNIVKAKYFDFAGIIPWYVVFVLLKGSIAGSSVSLYDKIVVQTMRQIERIITPPIGKNLLLVGKKD